MARKFGNSQRTEHAGEVRQSQLISTFGIGSIVDFVRDTVIIGGVDNWDSDEFVDERRLFNENLQAITGMDHFLVPKVAVNKLYNRKSQDIESFVFPRKLYCPICRYILDAGELGNQDKKYNCFIPNENKNGKPCGGRLVASRFVLVCENGHMEDFPYSWWAHRGTECEKKPRNPRIRMYNVGNRSDIDSLIIECVECGEKRRMSLAFSKNAFSGGNGYPCQGKHPHLGDGYRTDCSEMLTARLRSSSSVYFPATLSALTIPPWSRRAVQLIEAEYETLKSFDKLGGESAVIDHINKKVLPKAKNPITLSDLLLAFKLIKEQKFSSDMRTEADVFAAEYDVLCRGETNDEDDKHEYAASTAHVPNAFADFFDSITIIDKLTVVNALLGFTRVSPWDGNLEDRTRLVPLSVKKKRWLPAVKLLGEGIFFRLKKDTLESWENRIIGRYDPMANELGSSFYINERFSAQYVALHTFAHLLIRQLADDCGYSASSMKEKIYSTFSGLPDRTEMCGVLIYLATSDAEGSLGGLISIAKDYRRMEAVLINMLQKASWCSADPLCCNSTQQGFNSLNYAACHDCVLLPETSCEFRNILLDRVAVVGKPGYPELGLMGEMTASL